MNEVPPLLKCPNELLDGIGSYSTVKNAFSLCSVNQELNTIFTLKLYRKSIFKYPRYH
jgi:hypothetical protein